jgi:hypothetical protein
MSGRSTRIDREGSLRAAVEFTRYPKQPRPSGGGEPPRCRVRVAARRQLGVLCQLDRIRRRG